MHIAPAEERARGQQGSLGAAARGDLGEEGNGARRGGTACYVYPEASHVGMGEADVRGVLPHETVRRTVRRRIGEVRFCFEQELSRNPRLEGRLVIRFTILPAGEVRTAAIASSTVGNSKVERCSVVAVQRWSFPASDGDGVTVVRQPFELRP